MDRQRVGGLFVVETIERSTGDVITKVDSKKFIQITNFLPGAGRGDFLEDRVKLYNKKYPKNEARLIINKQRIANELLKLAKDLVSSRTGEITPKEAKDIVHNNNKHVIDFLVETFKSGGLSFQQENGIVDFFIGGIEGPSIQSLRSDKGKIEFLQDVVDYRH